MLTKAALLICAAASLSSAATSSGAPADRAQPTREFGLDRRPATDARAPRPDTQTVPAKRLDELFARLAATDDVAQAQGLAEAIQREWRRSGSDTADTLMDRAVGAIGARPEIAAALLDKVIALEPAWAEAWNKRATLRFFQGDEAGSMNDIAQVLRLEPRHFGALTGMGAILQRRGLDEQALKVYDRALEVYPRLDDIRGIADKLRREVQGRAI